MTRTYSRITPGSAIALSLLATAPAAPAEDGGITMLPETVVSAAATTVGSNTVGSAISVVTAEDIERRQASVIADVLRAVPGVSVNQAGPLGGATQARIRGAEGNHTLVVIDGVEANDPVSASEFNFAHLLADDIESIEVLRGPQSALWGSDAIGGVINVITRRATEGVTIHGRAEGGAFGTARGHAAIRGAHDIYDYSFSASRISTDGIDVSRAGAEDDGYENFTLGANAGFHPTDALDVRATLRFTDSRREFDRQDFGFASPTQGFIVDSDDHTDASQLYGGATGRLSTFDGRWEHELGAGFTRTRNDNFALGASTSRNDGEKRRFYYRSHFFHDTPEIAGASHGLTFHVERERELFANRGAVSPGPADQDQSATEYGYAVEYRVSFNDTLALSGSARLDENEEFDDSTTYRATASYRHVPTGTRLHGSVGSGVTNPTFFDLFGFFPGSFAGNPNLRPEASRGFDLGIEQRFLDGRLVADLTYFEADLEDEITTVFDPNTFISSPINQTGESERRGLELSARAQLAPNLDLAGSYTFLRSEDPDGRDEVRRPRHAGSIDLGYRFAGDRGLVSVGVDYNGRMQDAEFIFATPADRVTLNEFVLVDVAARYALDRNVTAFARAENLLDEDYEEIFTLRSPGFGAFVGLEVRFGPGG